MAKVFIAGAGYVGAVAGGAPRASAGHVVDIGRRTPGGAPRLPRHGRAAARHLSGRASRGRLRDLLRVRGRVHRGGLPGRLRDGARERDRGGRGGGGAPPHLRLLHRRLRPGRRQRRGRVLARRAAGLLRPHAARRRGAAGRARRSRRPRSASPGSTGRGADRLIRMVRIGRAGSAKSRAAITNRIHRDDCARALVHLVERPAVAPLYLGSDEAPTPMGEILDWIAARLGLPPPPRRRGLRPVAPARRQQAHLERAAARRGLRASSTPPTARGSRPSWQSPPGSPELDPAGATCFERAQPPVQAPSVREWPAPNSRKEQTILAKPNYAFEKRKRELEQKRKKEEKLQKKMQNKQAKAGDGARARPATDARDAARLRPQPRPPGRCRDVPRRTIQRLPHLAGALLALARRGRRSS